jgi:hypothetical protein
VAVLLALLVLALVGLPSPGTAQSIVAEPLVGAAAPPQTDTTDTADTTYTTDASSVPASEATQGTQQETGLPPADARLAPAPTLPPAITEPVGVYLMDIKNNVKNWDQATAGVRGGLYGWDWPATFPCGNNTRTWTGVLCMGGDVIQVNLANLGLKGELSVEVMKVPTLEALDLSSNGGY